MTELGSQRGALQKTALLSVATVRQVNVSGIRYGGLNRVEARSGLASRETTGAAVRLVDFSKHYGSVLAVQNVNLEINPGEFVTLLGPSGSGKTTTLTMVAGFVKPSGGQIYIDGQMVLETPPHRRGIGMVFQDYALFPHRTVAQNVAFPLKMRRRPAGEIRAAVSDALELVHLSGYEDRYPGELSGGQQQRVALARATVFRPRLLLMDEPLGALDRKLRQTLQFELKEIQRQLGVTVISVTHDQEEALTMSDRIVVMDAGRIVQMGTPQAVYKEPSSAFVADFVGETNLLEGKVSSATATTVQIDVGHGFSVSAESDARVGTHVTVAIRPEHVRLNADALDHGNYWDATVVGAAYAGSSIRYVVEISQIRVVVRVDSLAATSGLAVGEKVSVSFDPAAVRILAPVTNRGS